MLTNNIQMVKIDEFGENLDEKEILEASKGYISQLTLKISKVAEMSEIEQQKLFEILNQFKFVILNCEPLPNPQENLLALKKFFGSIKKHKLAAQNGVVSIENLGLGHPLSKTYVATTNQNHLMHTDASFDIAPPKIVAMQCEVPSKNGGLSQIVHGESVYEYLRENYPQELQSLLTCPLTITRGDQTATRAMFVAQEGRISMTFRGDSVISLEIPHQVEKGYNIIKNYVNDIKNQIVFKLKAHEIVILDNTSVVHGRTSFPDNEFRKLNRLTFDGISEYSHHIQFGFIPKSKFLNA